MNKELLRHLQYELDYAEEKHPEQDRSLESWLVVLRDKADKCIKETRDKKDGLNNRNFSGCGYSGEEEMFSVLFACMAIAYRGIIKSLNTYKISRLECFKNKGINIDTVDEIELKMYELKELQRELETNRDDD